MPLPAIRILVWEAVEGGICERTWSEAHKTSLYDNTALTHHTLPTLWYANLQYDTSSYSTTTTPHYQQNTTPPHPTSTTPHHHTLPTQQGTLHIPPASHHQTLRYRTNFEVDVFIDAFHLDGASKNGLGHGDGHLRVHVSPLPPEHLRLLHLEGHKDLLVSHRHPHRLSILHA